MYIYKFPVSKKSMLWWARHCFSRMALLSWIMVPLALHWKAALTANVNGQSTLNDSLCVSLIVPLLQNVRSFLLCALKDVQSRSNRYGTKGVVSALDSFHTSGFWSWNLCNSSIGSAETRETLVLCRGVKHIFRTHRKRVHIPQA